MTRRKTTGATLLAVLAIAATVVVLARSRWVPSAPTESGPAAGSDRATRTPFVVSPMAGTPDIRAMDTAVAAGDWETYEMLAREMDVYLAQNGLESYTETFPKPGPGAPAPDMDQIEADWEGGAGPRRLAMERLAEDNPHAGGRRALEAVVAGLSDPDHEVRWAAMFAADDALIAESMATEMPSAGTGTTLGDHAWLSDKSLAAALGKAADTDDTDTMSMVIQMAHRMTVQSPDLEAALIRAYSASTDTGMQGAVVSGLGFLGFRSEDAKAVYIEASASSHSELRSIGAGAMADALGAGALPLLEAMLAKETDPDTRIFIEHAIEDAR